MPMTNTPKGDPPPPDRGGQLRAPVDDENTPGCDGSSEHELPPEILNKRICDFDLRIEGGPLENVIERFRRELAERGITKLQPAFYLSDEWGVSDGTVAIAIPFYLADERLRRVQQARSGVVEGKDDEDILRYLRHEMGHVVNYAYHLYENDDWTTLFGPMSRPYTDEYRSVPFSPDFVRHLPGNYAQKHPDDDWAETFAVWMTPGSDWTTQYQDASAALAKLLYCERVMADIKDREPYVTHTIIDEDVRDIQKTVAQFYDEGEIQGVALPRSLDGDLRGIFSPYQAQTGDADAGCVEKASSLIRRHEDELADAVYWWTGMDHALTYALLDHVAERAERTDLSYPLAHRDRVLVQLAAFLTTLAMNYVYRGSFIAT
jgi:hypothetical protein